MYRPLNFQQLNCVNHPEKASVENCEVCGTPLCNFCLYYVEDGQRLCQRHAREAQDAGKVVYPPETYSDGIISAQIRATENRIAEFKDLTIKPAKPFVKGAISSNKLIKYQANNHDVMGFVGLMAGVFFILGIFSGGFCVPVIGALASISAILNAKDAVDKKRTRTQGWLGLLFSGGLLLGMVCIIAMCYVSTLNAVQNTYNPNYYGTPYWMVTSTVSTSTPVPTRTRAPIATLTPTHTSTPSDTPTPP